MFWYESPLKNNSQNPINTTLSHVVMFTSKQIDSRVMFLSQKKTAISDDTYFSPKFLFQFIPDLYVCVCVFNIMEYAPVYKKKPKAIIVQRRFMHT